MRRQFPVVCLVVACVLAPHSALGTQVTAAASGRAPAGWHALRAQVAPDANDSPMRNGFNLFGQLGAGINGVSGGEFQDAPFGGNFMVGALASWRSTSWVLDAGANWRYLRSIGRDAVGNEISIRTREGTVEASPRYRLTEAWQLGPVAHLAFGTDTSKGPSVGPASTELYAGLKVAYEMPLGGAALRAFVEATQDWTVRDRTSRLAMIGLQIGLPIGIGRGEGNEELPIRVSSAAPERGLSELRVALDPAKVFFDTNSKELKPLVARTLRKVGTYLRDNDGSWSTLEVSGHADRRGRYEYNLELSRKRAESVMMALEAKDLEEDDRLTVRAYSYSLPLDKADTPQAWARNRRVELVFQDVEDPAELKRLLKPLTKESSK